MRAIVGSVMVVVLGGALGLGLGSAAGAEKTLFEQRCASCHGKDGQAGTGAGKAMHIKGWRVDDDVKKMSDARLREIIVEGVKVEGKQRMPPNRSLAPEQLDELVKEVRKLAK
jgi:mono/diheme cytochrome c family protein